MSKPDDSARIERSQTVLLCAAPGTGLSYIAESLRSEHDENSDDTYRDAQGNRHKTVVWDLEQYICRALRDTDDEGTPLPVPKMSAIVMKDRKQLHQQWESSFEIVVNEIAKSDATTRIVCMHLTWYNSEWKEFYSPIDVRSITADRCHIDHVVILIDDIYDMFSRLNRGVNLYDDRGLMSMMEDIRKLSLTDGRVELCSEPQLRIQAIESALGELLAWRKAEMIQAENIARSLRCDLTILATKHSRDSLRALVSHTAAPRIYLSHRISELRRSHMRRMSEDSESATWSPVAGEVNALHHALAKRDQVLINPTAIDELRFENEPSSGRRKARLTPRWPLSDAPLLWKPIDGSYHHHELLHDSVSEDDEIASHAARSLSIRISSDVWFRDHAIVEHTPNLCVYRPFYCEQSQQSAPNWSGGVGAELTHWMTYFTTRIESLPPDGRELTRRIAFVHTDREIEERCKYMVGSGKDEFDDLILSHVADTLDQRDIGEVLTNNPGRLKSALASASLTARYFSFTRLGRQAPAASVLLRRVEEDEECNAKEPDDLAEELSEFFLGTMDEDAVAAMNSIFWGYCNLVFENAAGMQPVVYALEAVGKNTPEIRESLGLESPVDGLS